MVEFAEKINKSAGPNKHAVQIFCIHILKTFWKNKTEEINSYNQKAYEILKNVNRIVFYEDLGEILKIGKEMNFDCSCIAKKLINVHTLIRTCRLEKSI